VKDCSGLEKSDVSERIRFNDQKYGGLGGEKGKNREEDKIKVSSGITKTTEMNA